MIFKIRTPLKCILLITTVLAVVGVLIWILCSRYVFVGSDKIPIDSTEVRLDFTHCKIDRSLKRLDKISQMDMLDLYGVSDNDSLEYMSLPDSLTKLIVSCSIINDVAFVNSLVVPDITFFQTEVDLNNISSETSISVLRLLSSKISNLEKVADCRSIERLDIYQCNFGDDDKLYGNRFDSTILCEFDHVTSLELGGMEITDISGLLEMQSLRDLKIYGNCLSNDQLAELQSAGINIEII